MGGEGVRAPRLPQDLKQPSQKPWSMRRRRVSSQSLRSSLAAAKREHWKSKFLVKGVDCKPLSQIYFDQPGNKLNYSFLRSPYGKKTVVKFVAGLTAFERERASFTINLLD